MREIFPNSGGGNFESDMDATGVAWVAEQILLTDTQRYSGFDLGKESVADTSLIDRAEKKLGSFLLQAFSRPKSDW